MPRRLSSWLAVIVLTCGLPNFAWAQDAPPTVRLSVSAHLGVQPLEVAFDGEAETNPDAPIHTYRWSLDGEVLASGPSLTHRFTEPGHHEVRLTVVDAAGGEASESVVITVADEAWRPDGKKVSELDARRFLWQAAFGPNPGDLKYVMQYGYEAWIDRQLNQKATLLTGTFMRSRGKDEDGYYDTNQLIDDLFVGAKDQLRQRVAWALLQVIPIHAEFAIDNDEEYQRGTRRLFNTYLRHALPAERYDSRGRYDDLLVELTFNSAMANWLTYKNSTKASREFGTTPDENYAREIMQLFTIGLVQLEPDGTPTRDAEGQTIPNYTNAHVKEFARVFTGLIDGQAHAEEPFASSAEPTKWLIEDHDFGAKQLLVYPGVSPARGVIPAVRRSRQTPQQAEREVRAAIRNLFNHPSHPPFLARRMIQRFTTSNPTPGYVRRVAEAYAGDGPYGQGQRGDLAAMMKAILLDDEARNPAYRDNPQHGLVLEPMRVIVGLARAYELHEPARVIPAADLELVWEMDELTGQGFFTTPSVFNFYLPDFSPPNTRLRPLGMAAPELQILDEYRALAGLGYTTDTAMYLIHEFNEGLLGDDFELVEDPEQLVAAIAGPLDHGWLNDRLRRSLVRALRRFREPEERVHAALYLTLGHPAFRVLR
ncbi:MAG: DUF1800 family protein [Planctomycetota bacterium]